MLKNETYIMFENNSLINFIFLTVLFFIQNIINFSYYLYKQKNTFYERMDIHSRKSCCTNSQEIYIVSLDINLHIFVMLFHIKQNIETPN